MGCVSMLLCPVATQSSSGSAGAVPVAAHEFCMAATNACTSVSRLHQAAQHPAGWLYEGRLRQGHTAAWFNMEFRKRLQSRQATGLHEVPIHRPILIFTKHSRKHSRSPPARLFASHLCAAGPAAGLLRGCLCAGWAPPYTSTDTRPMGATARRTDAPATTQN